MKAYEQRKQERNFLDYDDILAIVAVHLQNSPELVQWVIGFCSALVDEMQDTIPLQWALLQPLIGKVKLFCVGDDAQSIYGFRMVPILKISIILKNVPDAEVPHFRNELSFLLKAFWIYQIGCCNKVRLDGDKHLQTYRGKGLNRNYIS